MTGQSPHTITPDASIKPAPSNSILQRKCACGQHTSGKEKCDKCSNQSSTLQRREVSGATESSQSQTSMPTSGGRSLSPAIANQFRSGLGNLVDKVNIHDGADGRRFAQSQGAAAVTSGANIYFAPGYFQPESHAGKNLLAHELAHVHQQHRTDGPPAGFNSTVGDKYELEADRFAETGKLTTNQTTGHSKPASIQRRTTAEQIASLLRSAVEGLGTDEEAIFNALTGRTAVEIAAITAAYSALAGGETLENRLRDELSGNDLSKALSLLHGETSATETARRLWNAMRGLGTRESEIYATVAGRTAAQWNDIQIAYKTLTKQDLLTDLRDELNAGEWQYLQTLLPGAAGGAVTDADRATVIANRLEAAMAGLGTDEDAIYTALTGRTQAELRLIETRFKLLTGFTLVARLKDELNDKEFKQARDLLHPPSKADRIAELLRDAVQGIGTDELEIQSILTGRAQAELTNINIAYQAKYGESLQDRLNDELSGADLATSERLRKTGSLTIADEIYLAVSGLGTDEERLTAALTEISNDANPGQRLKTVVDAYAAAGYGDMLDDISGDLSGKDYKDALALLLGYAPNGTCGNNQTDKARVAISGAVSMAQNAIAKLDNDIGRNRLSNGINTTLTTYFNPGSAVNAVTIGLARQVRGTLNAARTDLLTVSSFTCGLHAAGLCVAKPVCTNFTYGWTTAVAGSQVRLCPAFFSCLRDTGRVRGMLHEFVHHTGVSNPAELYAHNPAFKALTPIGDNSANDSLSHADSYASFAAALN